MAKKSKSKKILKKPKFKLKQLSAQKLVEQMGKEQGSLVRELPNPYVDPEQDTRSLYFKDTYEAERKKAFGGFL